MLKNIYTKFKLAQKYYFQPCYYDTPTRQNDFPQQFIDVNLNTYVSNLDIHKSFSVQNIKNIKYEQHQLPILKIDNQNTAAPKKLLIMSGVHGNETGGVLAIPKLLDRLENNPLLHQSWHILILTPINPIGVIFQSRQNENGCDLNRNFLESKEPGVEIQRQVIDAFQPNIILSLHESPAHGFLVHPNKYTTPALVNTLLKHTENQGIELSTKDYWGRKLTKKGSSRVNGLLQFLAWLINIQSMESYVEALKIPVITTESGWRSTELYQRVDSHVHFIEGVLLHYNT